MYTTVVIALLTLLVALNGLVYEPKRDPKGPTTLKNLNAYGIFLIFFLILLSALSVFLSINSSKDNEELQTTLNDVKNQNLALISKQTYFENLNVSLANSVEQLTGITDDVKRKVTQRYISITYSSMKINGNCDGRSPGEIYYSLLVDGQVAANLLKKNSHSMSNGDVLTFNAPPVNIPFIFNSDKISLSGWVRESDSGIKFEELGNFNKELTIEKVLNLKSIPLNSLKKCNATIYINAEIKEN